MTFLEAVREGERFGNRPNKWHLVRDDTGIGPITTRCNRVIDRSVAATASREAIERENENNPHATRCKRCWGAA